LAKIADTLKDNLVGINKEEFQKKKDMAPKELLSWIYEMNIMKEWFECFATYTLYPDMDSRIVDTNIGKLISLSEITKKRGSVISQEISTMFNNIDANFNGPNKKINGWQQKPFGLTKVTEEKPYVWNLFLMNYIAFLHTKVFVELDGTRLMKHHYNKFPRNSKDPKTRGRFTFGDIEVEEVVPMKTFWDFEPVLPDTDKYEDEKPYRLKTLAAMVLAPRHNPYRVYRNGDETLLASRFNIVQTNAKKKNITKIDEDPEPPIDQEKIINELKTKWEAVATQRKERMITQLDETVSTFQDLFEKKKVKKLFKKNEDPKKDNSAILRDEILKRLQSNKKFMMKDFNVDDPVLHHDVLSDDEEGSDSDDKDNHSSVGSGSEEDSEEEKSENEDDSNYSSEEQMQPRSTKRKNNKKDKESPKRPPKRSRKNEPNEKSPKRSHSKRSRG
jgi:hypothetical protein